MHDQYYCGSLLNILCRTLVAFFFRYKIANGGSEFLYRNKDGMYYLFIIILAICFACTCGCWFG
jgi:hypothetical protein